MKNREWLLDMALYDLLMLLVDTCCPIWALTDKQPVEWDKCDNCEERCATCLQAWLNDERE